MEADNDNENLLYVVVFVQTETFSITSSVFVSEKFFGEKSFQASSTNIFYSFQTNVQKFITQSLP